MKISHLNTNVFISYDKYITLDERLKLRFHVENDDSPPCSCQLCWVIDQALLVGDHLPQILLSLYWPVLLSLTHRVELLTRPHQTVGDFTFLVDDTLSADDASLYITPVTQFNNCVKVRSRRLDWDWIHITLLTVGVYLIVIEAETWDTLDSSLYLEHLYFYYIYSVSAIQSTLYIHIYSQVLISQPIQISWCTFFVHLFKI